MRKVRTPTTLSQFKEKMKEVILRIDDSVYEKVMGFIQLCPMVEVVGESDFIEIMIDRDRCMLEAIQTLRENNVFQHYYDYTWVMMAINEGQVEDFEAFKSPQAFLNYLYKIGVENLPSRYSLSLAYSKTLETYPDWKFIDVDDASEILRRKNVVKQFLSAYGKAKRGIFNKIFNK